MRATIKDVAREAGVSDTAVSLAFKDSSRVSEQTRRRILAAARKLNYVPNSTARNLRSGKTRTVGFIVNDITNPFYSLMLKEAEGELNRAGFDLLVADSNWDAEREVKLIERMIQLRVQGVIICPSEKSAPSIELLDAFSMPYVAVDSYPDFYHGAYVANDFHACGEIVAEHLYKIGCRNPGIIAADKSMAEFSAFKQIFGAFKEYFCDREIVLKPGNIVEAGLTIDAGRDAFKKLSGTSFDADAFFCANDLCAIGFMDAAEQAGIRIGEEIALVGIDDIPLSSCTKISLTSVKQPYDAIAHRAAGAITECILQESAASVQVEFRPTLVERNSTMSYKNRREHTP
jgi:DNA-binding LacI/PurR family transcriptional regulator